MMTRMRRLIAPSVFAGDEEKTQAADLLNTTLLAILVGTALYCVVAPIVAVIFVRRLIIAGALILLSAAMLFWMRRGYVRFTSVATVSGVWAMLTLAAALSGGVRAPAFSGYMIVVLMA